jgi:diguanylate cyclase (GGDEF)-like protein
MLAVSRDSDLVCRLGGDEFVLLLSGCADDDSARAIAQRTLEAIAQPLRTPDGSRVTVGASIGLTHGLGSDELDMTAPLRRADQAMYRAKFEGKHRVVIYDRRHLTRAPARDFTVLLPGFEAASSSPRASS